MQKIRPISICLLERNGAYLAQEYGAADAPDRYYRPPGGGIELGERAEDALCREMLEELQAEVCDVRQLAVFENIFEQRGKTCHEIVFLFAARFREEVFYQKDEFSLEEAGFGNFRAIWVPRQHIVSQQVAFYPPGLRQMIVNGVV